MPSDIYINTSIPGVRVRIYAVSMGYNFPTDSTEDVVTFSLEAKLVDGNGVVIGQAEPGLKDNLGNVIQIPPLPVTRKLSDVKAKLKTVDDPILSAQTPYTVAGGKCFHLALLADWYAEDKAR